MADSMEVDKQPTPEASSTVTKGKGPAGGKDDPRFVVKKVSHYLWRDAPATIDIDLSGLTPNSGMPSLYGLGTLS